MYLKVDKPLRGKRGGKEKRKARRKEDEVFRTGEKDYSREKIDFHRENTCVIMCRQY